MDQISNIPKIEVKRHYSIDFNKNTELHIFADSSNLAYGAVAYFRVQHENNFTASFIIGKSRLAPLSKNTLTIPKLELQAAVMATRLKVKIIKEGKFDPSKIYFWSDSKTVLKYIYNEHKRFSVFVTHRVNEIRLSSEISDWHFIPGNQNPADDCTRPFSFESFLQNKRYLNGPDFLYKPISQILNEEKDDFQDIRGSEVNENINTNILSKTQVTTFNWKRFSDYKKLLHRVAYLKLFARTCKSKSKVRKSDKTSTSTFLLSNDIIRDTENFIISAIQKEVFANEISQLKNNQQIVSTSMSKLNPIYCSDLIKVGGRLQNSDLKFENIHQIILPYDHHVTNLIIENIHKSNHHIG